DSAKQNLVDMGISKNRISVIINGAQDLTKYDENARALVRKSLGIPQNATVVTICARLEKCKDHLTFLNAAALICKKTDAYRFLIIGGGSLASTLSTLVKHLSIENKVIFTGFVNDVSPYMNITDVNVNCSVGTETSSLALSEGMSLGIPAVASDYCGNPYMVKNGQNGYIYPQRNAYELSKSILALEDKELYKAMSTNAKERFFTELNAKSMTRKTEALYKSLLNSKSVRL
ncbi:MAG: glycosyltransferase, partial [Clostridia bacterium]|nr:glycosyltransferase [Clostridia bacterium]